LYLLSLLNIVEEGEGGHELGVDRLNLILSLAILEPHFAVLLVRDQHVQEDNRVSEVLSVEARQMFAGQSDFDNGREIFLLDSLKFKAASVHKMRLTVSIVSSS